jgi:hypothetical protein
LGVRRINERREWTMIPVSTVLLNTLKHDYWLFPTKGLCCPVPLLIEPVLIPSASLLLPALQDQPREAAAARPAGPRPPSPRTAASPELLGQLGFKRSQRLRQLLDLGNTRIAWSRS